jgi:hypothetical protein
MATPLQDVYDAFLSKIEADDWMLTEEENVVTEDWRMLLNAAIMQFRYPRVSLDYDKESAVFTDDLGNDEIQILANLMKLEWIRRCISTWDNIRQLYSDKDFSQANFLDKLNKTGEQVRDECRLMLDRYGRSTNYRPSKIFGKLAGK